MDLSWLVEQASEQTPELTQADSVGSGLPVDPERHPGQHHDQSARQVHVDHEVARVTLQVEVHLQNRVLLLLSTACDDRVVGIGLGKLWQNM